MSMTRVIKVVKQQLVSVTVSEVSKDTIIFQGEIWKNFAELRCNKVGKTSLPRKAHADTFSPSLWRADLQNHCMRKIHGSF